MGDSGLEMYSIPPMLYIESKNVFFSTDVSDRSRKTIFNNSIVTWEIDNGVENKVYKGTVLWSENTVAFKGSFRWIVKYEGDGPPWDLDREEGAFDYFSTVYTYKDSILVVGSVQENL